jgi:hypothetical protein
MSDFDTIDAIDSINESARRIEGLAALIGSGSPAPMEPEGVSYLVDLLRDEAKRLGAVSDALGVVAPAD